MNRRNFVKSLAAGALILSGFAAPSIAAAQTPTKTIPEVAADAGTFKTLLAAVQAAGLAETLSGKGPFTVFAPTDEAFAKLPAGTLDNLLKPENKKQLTDILTFHVVAGSVKAANVVKLKSARTVNGARAEIKVADGKVSVAGAQVVATDILASNGVIHVIDSVMLPPTPPKSIVQTAVDAGNFKTLAAALQAADLATVLSGRGNFTVFAPTDEAFAKLPAGTVEELLKPENKAKLRDILLYHVASGRYASKTLAKHSGLGMRNGARVQIRPSDGTLAINGAKVTAADIAATNGVIHVIDTVILPPGNIVEVAAGAGTFNTLAAALTAAGLADTLTGRGPFTVFAPTDEAFAKLPAGTVEELLKPENKAKLRSILLYHVASANLDAATVSKHRGIRTLQGKSLAVRVQDGKVTIGGANVTAADILVRNGTIHVIDTVLLP